MIARTLPFQSNEELAALAQSGDKRARDQLVLQNLPYVKHMAFKFAPRCHHLDVDDLQTWGAMGLMVAIDKYDPSFGFKFLSYATRWIEARIRRAIQDEDRAIRIPGRVVHMILSGRLRKEWAKLAESGLTEEEIRETLATRYGWKPDTVQDAEWAMRFGLTASLDAKLPHADNMEQTMHDILADTHRMSAEEELDRTEELARLRGPLETFRKQLGPRKLAILDRRLLADGDGETLKEIAESFGLTRERIRQIEEQLVRQLRVLFGGKEEKTGVKRKNPWSRAGEGPRPAARRAQSPLPHGTRAK